MPLGMMVKQVIDMTALEEVVAMVGVGIARIAVLLAQCTGHDLVLTMVAHQGHDLVLTMVAHQVLCMVRMAGAGVLFVIAIGDLLVTDQDPHLPKEELMTNSELSAIVVGAGSLYLLFPSVISTSSKDYCAVF